jgi:hypothetical protein
MRTSQKIAGIIATIGIDIGKNTFHLVCFDQRGVIVLQQKRQAPLCGSPHSRDAQSRG